MPDPDPAACSLDMRMAVCRKVPLFADLDDGQLAQVNRHCQAQNFAAGEPVYLEGDAATHIYVVAIGAVKTTRLAADGRQSLIDLLTPGDFFGALPALGQQFYADSATALTPACLLGLDAPEYDAILQEIPQVAVATLKGVAQNLGFDGLYRAAFALTEEMRGGKPLTDTALYNAVTQQQQIVIDAVRQLA